MRTWHFELLFVSLILCTITFIFKSDVVNWITTAAVIFTFQHAQIADRLRERQEQMLEPSVECYHKLSSMFFTKEVLWIVAFIIMRNYAAITGSFLFAFYPFWRKFYRMLKPI